MLELNDIYAGDCVDVMKDIPDGYIDLTITSPPYDNLRSYNGYVFDFESIAKQLYRVTKEGGVVVWVVGDATINGSETGTSFRQALRFMDIGFRLHDTMIYEKSGFPFPSTNRYCQAFEYMFVLSHGKPKTSNLITDKKNRYSGESVARKHGSRNRDGKVVSNQAYKKDKKRRIKDKGIRINIWRIINSSSKGDKSALEHPATFPEALATDHILSWSNPDDIILDPMCGSGTTCKMAKEYGRNFIGIDISEKYVKLAKKRVQNARIPLFV